MIEGLSTCDIIHQQRSSGVAVVTASDRSKRLLSGLPNKQNKSTLSPLHECNILTLEHTTPHTSSLTTGTKHLVSEVSITRQEINHEFDFTYRIPYLKLYLMMIDIDQSGTEFHTDCQVMHWLKSLVCELQQQTTLPNTCEQIRSSTR
jgi:hypothetical protein